MSLAAFTLHINWNSVPMNYTAVDGPTSCKCCLDDGSMLSFVRISCTNAFPLVTVTLSNMHRIMFVKFCSDRTWKSPYLIFYPNCPTGVNKVF